jgi:hypothetical protein
MQDLISLSGDHVTSWVQGFFLPDLGYGLFWSSRYRKNRTGRIFGTSRKGQADRTGRTGQAEQERQNRTSKTGQAEQDRQNKKGRTGKAEQEGRIV